MDAHSTAVAIIDMELDFGEDMDEHGVLEKVGQPEYLIAMVRRLQANHVWIREQLTYLQRRLVTLRLVRQRSLYEGKERLQRLLLNLQVKYERHWAL
ncbi:uncharacterized protein LOC122621700 [Drosophila teissieri]|uniref:uncharacterized protein LOC122621700 n=1 Tax=Drosophila teissieri TaxID=7243 RepID=UPI001CB9FCFB|nr:uncharacterized protein LOC122621700 [Drosophila teissieri]XP_043655590.1 uncharacterized protein LOC122621700 [Drosophila teissieri]